MTDDYACVRPHLHVVVAAFAILTTAAFVPVAGAACGDLNGSATLTASDALVCLQGAVGTRTLEGLCEPADNCGPVFPPCGDINGDDANTASDCLLILEAAVGSQDIASSCDCEGAELCGNGEVDAGAGETCDDGNLVDGDGCASDCGRAAGLCAGVEPVAGTDIAAELLESGFQSPVYVAAAPGDTSRVFVVEQAGTVRVVENGVLREEPFLDITDRVSLGDETGLLSIAFHPDYASNGWVFAKYSGFEVDNVLARFERFDGVELLDPDSEKILFTIPQDDAYHNGGQIQFAADGMLWIGTGDGNGESGGDPAGHAQADADLLGKLLRTDVDVEGPPYWTVPADNPNQGPSVASLIWAKGLRNPWRFSFDRETRDMVIADVGQGRVEEIDVLAADSSGGENFGWNLFEGTECFAGGCPGPTEFVAPIHQYEHGDGGASITGGYVYRGCAMPDLHGTYFYADFVQGFIRSLRISGGQASGDTDRTAALDPPGPATIRNPSSFGEDARGEIYVVDYDDGEVFKIVPR